MTGQHAAVQRLMELGFSQYEAQAYVGLLGREPLTGYALANVTGIPQPKVYETLRRLTAKGMVAAVAGEPARFVAVPADQLLAALAKGYIRHDIYVQEIWNEFGDVLAERWGPGMQQLAGELSARPARRPRPAGKRAGGEGGRRGRSA